MCKLYFLLCLVSNSYLWSQIFFFSSASSHEFYNPRISSSLQNLLSCLSSPETKSSGYFGWKCCSSLPLSSTDSLPWLRAHLLSFTASIKSSLSSLQLPTDREWITSSSRLSAAATLLTFSSSLYLCWGLAQLVPARLSVALERINGM